MAYHEAALFMLRRPLALPLQITQAVIAGRDAALDNDYLGNHYTQPGEEAWNLVAERLDVLHKAIP